MPLVALDHCSVSWKNNDVSSLKIRFPGSDYGAATDLSRVPMSDKLVGTVQRYWRRGGYPCSDELQNLQSFEEERSQYLAKTRDRSAELMQQIWNLCQKLIDLEHEQEIEESKLSLSRSLHSPIRSLPLEILCQIFHFCNPDRDFKRPSMYSAPLLLGQVCKYWRDVAYNEPSLWTHPRLCFYDGTNPTGSQLLRSTLNLYKCHSKDAEFAISINQSRGFNPRGRFWRGDMTEIFDILPRCRELRLSCVDHMWLESFSDLDPEAVIRLRSISIKLNTPLRLKQHLEALSLAPWLRSVHLYLADPEALPVLSLPHAQLVHLSCTMNSCAFIVAAEKMIYQWRSFVAKCPDLQTIDVYFIGRGWCDRSRLNPRTALRLSSVVSFDHARSLILRVGFQADIATILADFLFPNLENMEVIATSNPISLINPDISFSEGLTLRLSYVFRLTSLRLIRVTISSSELRALFSSAPLLISLDIMKGEFNKGLFEIEDGDLVYDLTIDPFTEGFPILPRLRDLRLYFGDQKNFSQEENIMRYATLAQSRYEWARRHLDTRDQDLPSSKMSSGNNVPSYPFRLHLKYQPGDRDVIPAIAQTVGTTTFPVLWPELADVLAKER